MLTAAQIDTIAKHYIIACIWADAPEGTRPRAARASVAEAKTVVRRFYFRNPDLVERALARRGYGSHPDAGSPEAALGHDLYLTTHGHGVGFADRTELGALAPLLHAAADEYDKAYPQGFYAEPEFYRGWLYLRVCMKP